VGVFDTWKFEARFTGPAEADLNVLRKLGDRGKKILEESGLAKEIRIDMRQRVRKIVPDYDQVRGRWTAVSREDIARSMRVAYDGLPVGLYREGDDLHPIVVRYVEEERRKVPATLETLQVKPALSVSTIPLSEVTSDIRTEWEDPIIVRWNRRRAVTVQSSPKEVTFPTLRAAVLGEFNDIDIPPGYRLEWQGEYDSTRDAQVSLIPGLLPAVGLMIFIVVALFNAYRPTLIIFITIPFVMIGITWGLLGTGAAFGFVALLGAMSLSGMMIKNAVVLIDSINENLGAGMGPYDAVVESALSRLRPVLLAAATTVLGVIPLLQDVFWISMAVTIMAGLAFGTILTMVLVPVFYTTFHRIPSPPAERDAGPEKE
jgi:multidrug efflux pump subunit AcrB